MPKMALFYCVVLDRESVDFWESWRELQSRMQKDVLVDVGF
jgi:hypothetical protein